MKAFIALLCFFILSACSSYNSKGPYYDPTVETDYLNVQRQEGTIELDAEKMEAASDAYYEDQKELDSRDPYEEDNGCPNGCT